jgi:hypothetical protein
MLQTRTPPRSGESAFGFFCQISSTSDLGGHMRAFWRSCPRFILLPQGVKSPAPGGERIVMNHDSDELLERVLGENLQTATLRMFALAGVVCAIIATAIYLLK